MQDCIRYKDAIEPTFSHWQDPKDKTSFNNEPYNVIDLLKSCKLKNKGFFKQKLKNTHKNNFSNKNFLCMGHPESTRENLRMWPFIMSNESFFFTTRGLNPEVSPCFMVTLLYFNIMNLRVVLNVTLKKSSIINTKCNCRKGLHKGKWKGCHWGYFFLQNTQKCLYSYPQGGGSPCAWTYLIHNKGWLSAKCQTWFWCPENESQRENPSTHGAHQFQLISIYSQFQLIS